VRYYTLSQVVAGQNNLKGSWIIRVLLLSYILRNRYQNYEISMYCENQKIYKVNTNLLPRRTFTGILKEKQILCNTCICFLCLSICLCNKNQLDALFILSLFRQSTSTYFGRICSPSSRGTLYIYDNWYVLCFLVDCWPADQQTSQLRMNSASSWFLLYRYIEMKGQQTWNIYLCLNLISRIVLWDTWTFPALENRLSLFWAESKAVRLWGSTKQKVMLPVTFNLHS
jgi:hypothetical protein